MIKFKGLVTKILFLLLIMSLIPVDNVKAESHVMRYCHLDMVWNWRLFSGDDATINKLYNTFKMNVANCEQGSFYGHTSAYYYDLIKDLDPALYQRIVAQIEAGHWGAMTSNWVEAYNRPVGAETIMRNIYYGRRWSRENLGDNWANMHMDVDTWGYPASYPTLVKHMGMDFMLLTRGFIQNTGCARWSGLDGTLLLAHWGPQETCSCNGYEDEKWEFSFCGDAGGGMSGGNATCVDFYEAIKARETSLEVHPAGLQKGGYGDTFGQAGVYISVAPVHYWMRRMECGLLDSEKFAGIAKTFFQGEYPAGNLHDCWKLTVRNTFHDSDAGTSIRGVFFQEDEMDDYMEADYDKTMSTTTAAISDALTTISGNIDTTGSGTSLLVYNSLTWERDGIVKVDFTDFGDPASAYVVDGEGEVVPSQVIDGTPKKLMFIAEGIPGLGYSEYKVFSGTMAQDDTDVASGTGSGIYWLENEFFRVEVDITSGWVSRIYDKVNDKEILDSSGKGNQIQIYDEASYAESTIFDAWVLANLDTDHLTKLGNADSVVMTDTGPIRAVIRVKHSYEDSTMYQDIALYHNMPLVYTHFNDLDWHEIDKSMCVSFPLESSITQENPTTEIQCGVINTDTAVELPTCAMRFFDVNNGSYGVSLLNDCKHACDYKRHNTNNLRMFVLKCSRYCFDDEYTDQGTDGQQEFTYALYPHTGDWKSKSPRKGYEFNYPLYTHVETAHDGTLPKQMSFVDVDQENIIVNVMKMRDVTVEPPVIDPQVMIIRMYEADGVDGTDAEIVITGGLPILSAELTDGIEWGESSDSGTTLTVSDAGSEVQKITVPIDHFQVKTIKVTFDSYDTARVVLDAEPASITADGSSTTLISAQLSYANGLPATSATGSVYFSTNKGVFTSATTVDCVNGAATAILQSAVSPGTAIVEASSAGLDGGSVEVLMGLNNSADAIVLTAEPTLIVGDGTSTSLISVKFEDENGFITENGPASVDFTLNGPGTLLGTLSVETSDGSANIVLQSAAGTGTSVVTATAAGVSQSIINVLQTASNARKLVLNASAAEIAANGASTALITASILDMNDSLMFTLTNTINFSVSGQGTLLDTTLKPVAGGIATVVLRSNFTEDTAYVSGVAGGIIAGAVDVEFSGKHELLVSVDDDTLTANGSDSAVVTAKIVYIDGSTVIPATDNVKFTVLQNGTGTLPGYDAGQGEDAVSGIATVAFLAGTVSIGEPVEVLVEVDGIGQDIASITLEPGAASSISLSGTQELVADDTSQISLTATLLDDNGNFVSDAADAITFSVDDSTYAVISGSSTVNASGGTAAVTLKSTMNEGTVIVTATGTSLAMATIDVITSAGTLVITSVSPSSPTQEQLMTIKVENRKAGGAVQGSYNGVLQLSIVNDDETIGSLNGTANCVNGKAEFKDIYYYHQGDYTATITGAGLTAAATSFTVTASSSEELYINKNFTDSSLSIQIPEGSLSRDDVIIKIDSHSEIQDSSLLAKIEAANGKIAGDTSIHYSRTMVPSSICRLTARNTADEVVDVSFNRVETKCTTWQWNNVCSGWSPVLPVYRYYYMDLEEPWGTIDGTDINEYTLRVYMLNEETEEWEMQHGEHISGWDNAVTLPLEHFSVYAVMAWEAPLEELIVDDAFYPSPFNPDNGEGVFIFRQGVVDSEVTISVYTVSGRLVKKMDPRPGYFEYNQVTWDGTDNNGNLLANGMYYYEIKLVDDATLETASSTGKLVIIR